MFFTARSQASSAPNQWHATPAVHNATRYPEWLNPQAERHGRNRTERHVTFDLPSHSPHEDHATHTYRQPFHPRHETYPPHLRTGSVAQDTRSSDIMGTVGHRHGGTHRAPSLEGAFEARTGARHDKENAEIRHDPPGRRMRNPVPYGVNMSQIAYPLLAPPPVPLPLIYDLRHPPNTLSFPSSSPHAGCGDEVLYVPLTPANPRQIRLISPEFPWAFDIGNVRDQGKEGVTCLEVLTALHDALQRPLTDTEWGAAGEDKHASLLRARDRRLAIIPSGNSGARTRRTVRFADTIQEHVQRGDAVLRVDWLGPRVAFGGLIKDDTFARKRLIPGAGEPPETWVVKLDLNV